MNKIILPLLIFAVSLPLLCNAETLLKYSPPTGIGAPSAPQGGGTRGLPKPLQVLAPAETALTSHSQPVLYWYSSKTEQQKVLITLAEAGANKSLLEKQMETPVGGGLQSLSLADYGVFLKPDENYRWSLAIVSNAEQGEGESISSPVSAAIVRYKVPAKPLAGAEKQAKAGYWYDALQELIESHSPLANDLLAQVHIKIPAL